MTPQELETSRRALGLNRAQLGRALELRDRDPGRYIGRWESGAIPVPGPVGVAVRLMLAASARQSLQEAVQEARAILTPDAPPTPVLEALDALAVAAQPQPKTRRRG